MIINACGPVGCEIELEFEELGPGDEGYYYRNPLALRPMMVLDIWLGYDTDKMMEAVGAFLVEHERVMASTELKNRPYLAVRHLERVGAARRAG